MFFDDESIHDSSANLEVDIPLRLAWSGVTDDNLRSLGLRNKRYNRGLGGMIACLLIGASVDRWVSYSRNKDFYTGSARYGDPDFTYRKIIAMVEELLDLGLIEEKRAKEGDFGWQSRMRASARLRKLAQGWGPFASRPLETICLRTESKRPAAYADSDDVVRMRQQLHRHNEAIGALKLSISGTGVDPSSPAVLLGKTVVIPAKRQLYRVFNSDWSNGGRMYGGFWQNLPGNLREKLLIDGEDVVELDFRHLHPRLLYACFDKQLEGDAYDVDGVERPLSKIAFQMLLNCSSRDMAVSALAHELKSSLVGQPLSARKYKARSLLQLLEQRHKPIRFAFYSEIGRQLQRVDSELMLRVMDSLLAKSITGLPVHDSLIVQCRHAATVKQTMDDELASTCGHLGQIGFQGLLAGSALQ